MFEMQLGEFEMQLGKFPQYLEYLQRAEAAAARLFRSFSNIQSQGQSPSRSNGNYCILVDLSFFLFWVCHILVILLVFMYPRKYDKGKWLKKRVEFWNIYIYLGESSGIYI